MWPAAFFFVSQGSNIRCHWRDQPINPLSSELKGHLIHQYFVATTICCICNGKIEGLWTGRPDANASWIILAIQLLENLKEIWPARLYRDCCTPRL
jgi:hypothetical protein